MNFVALDYSWTWRTVFLAAALTLGVFLLLPFLEMLSDNSGRNSTIQFVDTTTHLAPPPPQKPPEPEHRRSDRHPPKPKLKAEQRKLIPLSAMLNLGMAMGDVGGDFDMNFDVIPRGVLSDVGELVFELGDLDKAPQPLVRLRPIYPLRQGQGRLKEK